MQFDWPTHKKAKQMKNITITTVIGLLVFFAEILLTVAVHAAHDPKHVWIGTSTNTAGTGSIDDPFDGSTRTKFDALMATLTANEHIRIHLLPGAFETSGWGGEGIGWQLRNGSRLIGSGIRTTSLKLVNGTNWMITVVGIGNEIEVSDITVDCNGTNSPSAKGGGVWLFGDRAAIRRVRCLNPAAPAGTEMWALQASRGKHNVIEDCEVGPAHGAGQVSCITLNFVTNGVMRFNRVLGPGDTTNMYAFNHGYTDGLIVKGNYTEQVQFAIYADTGNYKDAIISENHFKDCEFGGLHAIPTAIMSNYIVVNNEISVKITNAINGFTPVGISFYCNLQDSMIRGNNVKFGDGVTVSRAFPIIAYNATNCVISQNRIHAPNNWFGPLVIINRHKTVVTGNVGYNGEDLGDWGVNQVELPQSLARRTITGSATLQYSDQYIGMRVTAAATVTLPDANGRSGKIITVCDESGNAGTYNITVATAGGGQSINGVSTYTIITNRGAVSLISDGANWFVYNSR
jgi:hypothetical protein